MKDSAFETQDMEKRLHALQIQGKDGTSGVNGYRALLRPWFPHGSFKYKSFKYNCL